MSTERRALDAYSQVVVGVADALSPSVASVRVRTTQGYGGGSASVLSADGFLLTSAPVVRGASIAGIDFSDGRSTDADVVGRDALSDLAVLRARTAVPPPASCPRSGDRCRPALGASSTRSSRPMPP